MWQKRSKYLSKYSIGLDRFIINDKHNQNNYLYPNLKNGLNSSKNLKNNQRPEIIKKSSSQFFANKNSIKYFGKLEKPNLKNIRSVFRKNPSEKTRQNKKSSGPKFNIKPINLNGNGNNNKILNSSLSIYKNKITKSVPKENNRIKTFYNYNFNKNNNIITNNNGSFSKNKRVKTPIITRNENDFKKLNKENKINKAKKGINVNNNDNIILNDNKNIRNNNIFQPVNIFSQFKRNKINNIGELKKNNHLFKKFIEEQKNNSKDNNNFMNNNIIVNNNIYNNNFINQGYNNNENLSSQMVNKTSDITPNQINSNNNLNNKSNSNHNIYYKNKANSNNKLVFDKNIDCHEINFHVQGVSSSINLKNTLKPKKKIFKGKKIKCMHDLSKTGLSGDDKKVNQDNYFIFKNFVQGFDNIFMGVCDGHGYYGHEVSGFIKENLPMDLNHLIKTKKLNVLTDDLSQIIKTAFIIENKSLLRNKQIDSDLSGSTCISVIYTPQKLIIANLGDSRCILGKCIEKQDFEEKDEIIGEKNKINTKWVAENLSRDHKPTIPEEAERILKVGGRIRPMKDEDGEFIGPMRVYMRDKDMPGLAMTRSFGDYFGSTAGVISEPEVTEYFFKPEDKFIVLASDGLFEFIESQEIIDIIKDYYEKNDIVGCCEYLYKESTRKWIQEEEDTVDDITMILVFFEDLYEELDE